jgi:hypothetical protein
VSSDEGGERIPLRLPTLDACPFEIDSASSSLSALPAHPFGYCPLISPSPERFVRCFQLHVRLFL